MIYPHVYIYEAHDVKEKKIDFFLHRIFVLFYLYMSLYFLCLFLGLHPGGLVLHLFDCGCSISLVYLYISLFLLGRYAGGLVLDLLDCESLLPRLPMDQWRRHFFSNCFFNQEMFLSIFVLSNTSPCKKHSAKTRVYHISNTLATH